MGQSEQAFWRGASHSAIQLGKAAIAIARTEGKDQELLLTRRVQDYCFQSLDFDCILEMGKEIHRLVSDAASAPDDGRGKAKAAWTEGTERAARLSLLWDLRPQALQLIDPLARGASAVETTQDYVQTNITLANLELLRDDIPAASEYTRRAWLHFLASKWITEERFAHHLASFLGLFRATGQTQRALTVLNITQKAREILAPAYKFEGLALTAVETLVHGDRQDVSAAISATNRAIALLESVDFAPDVKQEFKQRLTAQLLLDCAIRPVDGCPTAESKEGIVELLKRLETLASSVARENVKRGLAIALVVWDVVNGQPIEPLAETILNRVPPSGTTMAELRETTAYLSGQYFIRHNRHDSDAAIFIIGAAKNEVLRLRRLMAGQPFDIAPINTYSYVIFSIAAAELTQQPARTSDENALLLELASFANRSPRSVESQYLYAIAHATSVPQAESFRGLFRTEQNLAKLEREALVELINELSDRRPGRAAAQFDTSMYIKFADLTRRIASYGGTRADLGNALGADTPLLSELQATLQPGERLITHIVAISMFLRVCVSNNQFSVASVRIDSKDAFHLRNVQLALSNPSPPSAAVDLHFPVSSVRRLTELVLGHDDSCVGSGTNLIFAPNSEFLSIPFHVLLDPSQQGTMSLDDDAPSHMPWLGIWHPIATVIDVRQLLASRRANVREIFGRPFLGVGQPVLRGNLADGTKREDFVLRGAKSLGGRTLTELDELPETGVELSKLASTFGGGSEVLLGDAASELSVRQKLMSTYRVISFATHGLVREEIEGVPEPALILTPRDSLAAVDDGLLKASEIANLDIKADLVILSACNSAQFDLQMYAPETASLSTAFFLAGARTTLASLWSVDSKSTADLMELFGTAYAKASERGVSVALHSAIKEFLRETKRPELAHPRFWAAFSVFGDGFGRSSTDADGSRGAMELVSLSTSSVQDKGEIVQLAQVDNALLIQGYRLAGKPRVIGQLQMVDYDGVRQWLVEDERKSFYLLSKHYSDTIDAIAWSSTGDGANTEVEIRTYSRDGILERSVPVNGIGQELIYGAVKLESGKTAMIAKVGSGSNGFVIVRLIAEDGVVVASDKIAPMVGFEIQTVRMFPNASGFFVGTVLQDHTQQPGQIANPLGIAEPCGYPVRTNMTRFSSDLTMRTEYTPFVNSEPMDILNMGEGITLGALKVANECRPYESRSALMLWGKGEHPLSDETMLLGFSHHAQRIVTLPDGDLLVGGWLTRFVDYWRLIPSQVYLTPLDSVERLRSISASMHTGAYFKLMGPDLAQKGMQTVFAGMEFLLDDLLVLDKRIFVGGTSGGAQFLGELRIH